LEQNYQADISALRVFVKDKQAGFQAVHSERVRSLRATACGWWM